jgi:hypothetical protein
MTRILLALLLAVGCKSSDDKAADDFAAIADKMCACTDRACIDSVVVELKAYTDGLRSSGRGDTRASEAIMERMAIDGDRASQCMAKYIPRAWPHGPRDKPEKPEKRDPDDKRPADTHPAKPAP